MISFKQFLIEVDDADLLNLDVGASNLQHTDSSITGNLFTGIGGFENGTDGRQHFWDDFEGADTVVGGDPPTEFAATITPGLHQPLQSPPVMVGY